MNARMFMITAGAVVALAGPAAQSASALISGDGNTGPVPAPKRVVQSGAKHPATTHRGNFGANASTRASRLLHNPGLPAWIP